MTLDTLTITTGPIVGRTPSRFELGRIVATPGALAAFALNERNGRAMLARHVSGDWGDLDAEDKRANDQAVIDGDRILSAYDLPNGQQVWIITEGDRSATTFLLPSEY